MTRKQELIAVSGILGGLVLIAGIVSMFVKPKPAKPVNYYAILNSQPIAEWTRKSDTWKAYQGYVFRLCESLPVTTEEERRRRVAMDFAARGFVHKNNSRANFHETVEWGGVRGDGITGEFGDGNVGLSMREPREESHLFVRCDRYAKAKNYLLFQAKRLDPLLSPDEIAAACAAIDKLNVPIHERPNKQAWSAPGIEGAAKAVELIPDGYDLELSWRRTQP